jgi:hypothetical protein
MQSFLMIENPGVCPTEGFILLGASSKHLNDSSNPYTIGIFGSGAKHAAGVLLRNGLSPIVFCGNHKLEFFTKAGKMQAVDGDSHYERICVKHGGKDASGTSVTFTEETSQTASYGYMDWDSVAMGLREYVSNALDAAIAVNEEKWDFEGHGGLKTPWDGVKVEIVNENRVRAKAGYTRVFVPLTNERLGDGQAVILSFYNTLGKWFLHFSEPNVIMDGVTILPKRGRNIGEANTAVIYRRGVRVREIDSYESESIFDYNLNDLRMDESRNVDDYACRCAAAKEMAKASSGILAVLFRSFVGTETRWEWSFSSCELRPGYYDSDEQARAKEEAWGLALASLGSNAVLVTADTPKDVLISKGYVPVEAPESFVRAGAAYGILTAEKVLNEDERSGREVIPATVDAVDAVEWAWVLLLETGMVGNDRDMPEVKCFRTHMDAGSIRMGFYRDGVVYINEGFASGSGEELRQIALEEVVHYVTGSTDCSRDFQDFALKLAVRVQSAFQRRCLNEL